ncbi:MAG: AglZ/HisF2 family acetamidino modification protein [Chlorobium sp.]|uniref:AglZ/HisF2 family acetamidino modification protein n=1 Tax=Chlorobium sp. TaxID=1095 RepID=UPI002F3FE2D2
MLRPRLIPCLLIHNGGLVKTVRFGEPKYVGDPINAVRIYNEKEVDELVVLDIDATVNGVEPDYRMISHLAAECRMPLCYGGGVRTIDQFDRIISLGVEKVAISATAIENQQLITDAARRIGSQSVVVVLDVKKTGLLRHYEVVTHNGMRRTGLNPVDFVRQLADAGAGEIVVNSVDFDGELKGYDFQLIDSIRKVVTLPLTVLGGAGSLEDIEALVKRYGIIGAAAGSIFVFKGKYRAVLINYPNRKEKVALYQRAGFQLYS